MKNFVKILSVLVMFTGCTAIYTSMSKSDLNIQTSMSATIWLEPTNPATTSIFVQTRNTSDNKNFNDLNNSIRLALMNKGYKITNNPDEAKFILQANVLKAVMLSDSTSAASAKSSALLTGAGVGFAVGSGGNDAMGVGAGLLAGLGSMYIDAKTKDNYYVVKTDIKITDGSKSFTTVLTILANKVNLTPEEVAVPIKDAIANSLSGLF